jgi:hypothetical protein
VGHTLLGLIAHCSLWPLKAAEKQRCKTEEDTKYNNLNFQQTNKETHIHRLYHNGLYYFNLNLNEVKLQYYKN